MIKIRWNALVELWYPLVLGGLGLLIALSLMSWRLAGLTPGLSETEIATYNSANSVADIFDNALNGPYKIGIYLSTRVFNNAFGLRIVGALIGVVTIGLFYLIAQKLLIMRNALITTVLFATSSIFLHTTRLASPNVMLLSLLALVAIGAMVRFDKRTDLGWILASIIVALSLYTPGIIIFVIIGALWQLRRVKKSFSNLSSDILIICAVIFSLLLAPLIISIIRDPALGAQLIGIPESLPNIKDFGESLLRIPSSIFAISPDNPVYWLGRQPILDVFSIVMIIYGLISLFRQFRLERLVLFVGIFVLSSIWIAISGNHQAIIILIPFLYLIIGMGIQDFTDIWLAVFPRNPIARYTGLCLLIVAVALTVN
ncbi:MAG: glycosyltransferase family 39 protein, partial [bacterium]|nr:glycosyltransferase family 39 protein [bacterium]